MTELNRIADALEVSSSYLLTGADQVTPAPSLGKVDQMIVSPYRVAIPWLKGTLLGQEDEECFDEQTGEMYEVPSWIVTGQPEKHMALTPIGMSMFPRIEPGSLVVVKHDPSPGTGVLVCVRSRTGATFIKGSVINRETKKLELHSVNEGYEPITDLTDWTMLGAVVAIKHPHTSLSPNIEFSDGAYLRFK